MNKKRRIRPAGTVLLIVLTVLILAVGSFWFYCRAVNRRSFMAGVVDLVLTAQHRSDKFTDLDECEAYIAGKAETNRAPVRIQKAKFGISVREDADGPLQTFVYNEQEHPAQTVFYFHGGAYINQPNSQQRTMAARTAKETGSEVVLMVYPKEPVYDCETAYALCLDYYRSYVRENDCGKVIFMGDSAGGGLALGLAEVLRDEGDAGPEELILISPWVDVTMSNGDMADYVDLEPMLGIDGLRRMGEVWANGLPLTDPSVSPIYGDLAGLGRVTLTTGTWEILYPDELLLAEKLKAAGTECELIVGERMIHCYPICPIPEAKDAQAVIWNAITRCKGTPGPREIGKENTMKIETVWFVNGVKDADIWILPQTEKNLKTTVWGTATASGVKTGERRETPLCDPGDDGLCMFRMIDTDHYYYSANGITLKVGWTLQLKQNDLHAVTLEVSDENGVLIQTYNVFAARL